MSDTVTHILNQQLQLTGLNFIETEHVNLTVNPGSGTLTDYHYVEQASYSDAFAGGVMTGSLVETINQNHTTVISDYGYTEGGNTYSYHGTYTLNGDGTYNATSQEKINGHPAGVLHFQG